MKRLLHLILALAVLVSMSACARGNNQGNNRVGVRNNAGTDVRRLTQQNTNNVTYRDGVYTGYGDAHGNGNEAATVTIRNGRIADIDLMNVGPQGGTNNTTGTRTGNGTNFQTGTGTNTGTTAPGTTGEGTTGRAYTPIPGTTTDNTTDTGMGTRTGTGTGITGGTAGDAINGVRTRLVNAMIRDQRYDVTIDNYDTTFTGSINNWKLAVRRALEQAR